MSTGKTNIATGAKTEYTWNHANQLTAVTFKTSTNVVTKSVQYQYDALGRRIGKSVDDTGDGTMDRRESYIYDGAGLHADAASSIRMHLSTLVCTRGGRSRLVRSQSRIRWPCRLMPGYDGRFDKAFHGLQ